jgi:hypothetical protein
MWRRIRRRSLLASCFTNFFPSQKEVRFHRHPIEEKNAPQGEMDGMFETCHLAGYEKTKTPPSIGFKVQRFPAALQSDSLPPGVQIGEGNWR